MLSKNLIVWVQNPVAIYRPTRNRSKTLIKEIKQELKRFIEIIVKSSIYINHQPNKTK